MLLTLVERGVGTKVGSHTPAGQLRERAARVICFAIPPGVVLRLARASQEDNAIIQSLLQIANLSTDELVDLCAFLVEQSRFGMHQYGLSTVAENGRMPISFVPAHFARADDQTRAELCRCAEVQLAHRGDESLHRFMLQVVYGNYPGALRATAWSCLHRWYLKDDSRGDGPFKLEPTVIDRFFGSVVAFLPRLSAVLRDRPSLKEVMLFDHLAHLLSYPDPAIVPAILAEEAEAYELARALIGVVATQDYYAFLRTGAGKMLGLIGGHPRWRDEVVASLELMLSDVNYDLVLCVKQAIAAITGTER